MLVYYGLHVVHTIIADLDVVFVEKAVVFDVVFVKKALIMSRMLETKSERLGRARCQVRRVFL